MRLANCLRTKKNLIPEAEQPKAINAARAHLAIYAVTIVTAPTLRSGLPLMLIGPPRLHGCWRAVMTGLLQHGGLAENVVDHRLNSRTVYLNPLSRFVYWNMNYHVEHHMFPMAPYHALPRLHALIKDDLPAANSSIPDAYLRFVPALLKQTRKGALLHRRAGPTMMTLDVNVIPKAQLKPGSA